MDQEKGMRDWAMVLKKLEEKLEEERAIFQEKIKQAKVVNDSLKLQLEKREKELQDDITRRVAEADALQQKLTRELTESRKELQDRQSAWEKMNEKKDNDIAVIKEEYQTLNNTIKD
jgi:hypothetical protein